MVILGIDFGIAKTGVALATTILAEPLGVIRHRTDKDLLQKLSMYIDKYKVEKIVIGVSEGKMGKKQREVAKLLQGSLSIQVDTSDETLSTHDAQTYSVKSGMKRIKRRRMEDAYAAAIMLQGYLDNL